MGTLLQDLRYGLRMLAKDPGFTVAVVLSLALGIGANATIFTFANALLFRPPAVEAPGRLLEVWNRDIKGSGAFSYFPLTYPDYAYYRDRNQVFSGFLAFDGDGVSASWSNAGQGESVQVQLVSGNFFSVLGLAPILGRSFLPEEDQVPNAHPVVVLSHAFWTRHLGQDPGVLGKAMTLNGVSYTAIGVAPPSFTGIMIGNGGDFWAPLATAPQLLHDANRLANTNAFWLMGVGRLKPGVTPSQAQAALAVLSRHLQQARPRSHNRPEAATFPLQLVPEPFRRYVAGFTGLLMAVVAIVLLIACANAANLLLARGESRRHETAIRVAMGASRRHLVQQTLTESFLLSSLAGGAGFVLVPWAVSLLLTLKPPSIPIRLGVPLDWRVAAFTVILSFFVAILFGSGPAARSSKADVALGLKHDPYGGGYGRSRLRSLLVVAEIAVCLVLLVGAGLCVRSLLNARSTDPGFDTRNTLAAVLDPGKLGYSESQRLQFYRQLLERVEALPGVTSASLASYLPLGTANSTQAVVIEGYPAPPGQPGFAIGTTSVGPEYFRTMGIPLFRGREFVQQETEGDSKAVIINEAMARRFWPGQDPIGKRIGFPGAANERGLEIVGVVKTGKYRTLSEEPRPFMYLPLRYHGQSTIVVRAAGDPKALLPALRHEIQALDPNVVPIDLGTLSQYMQFPLFPARTAGLLLGAFGLLGLVLAIVGVYGVIAHSVSQRTREIGIRMALGAEHSAVRGMVLRQGLKLTVIGLSIGMAVAFATTRVLSGLLYGIRPTNPETFAGAALLLAAVALLATYIPARLATKVDPMVALRYE